MLLVCCTCCTLSPTGREDPWVVPLWGQRLKRSRPEAAYYELSPVGHCPHHEAPTAINQLITEWVAGAEEGRFQGPLPCGESWEVQEWDGGVVQVAHVAGQPRNVFEHLDALGWRLQQALSQALGQRPTEAAAAAVAEQAGETQQGVTLETSSDQRDSSSSSSSSGSGQAAGVQTPLQPAAAQRQQSQGR
jgi:hypothetical protein